MCEPFDISVIKEIEKQFKIKIPEVLKKITLSMVIATLRLVSLMLTVF